MKHRQNYLASVPAVKAGVAVLLAALVAGCSDMKTVSTAPPAPPATTAAKQTLTPAQLRELARLRADIRRLKVIAAPVHHSLMGAPKLMAATSTFLDHEQASSLDNLTKNHLISLAASAVAGSCDQCFQQLEAARPIPAIAHP